MRCPLLRSKAEAPSPWPDAPADSRLRTALAAWAKSCPLPLVLLVYEIDSLSGRALISVLSQLRAGHNARVGGGAFPASVVLCGMRKIRDYKAASGGNPETLMSASPFNITVQSLRIANFTREQVAELYAQHTAETGQPFAPSAVHRAFEYTQVDILPGLKAGDSRLAVHAALRVVPAAAFAVLRGRGAPCPGACAGTTALAASPRARMLRAAFASA